MYEPEFINCKCPKCRTGRLMFNFFSKGYEDGKEYGLNAKQDYADKAYQQAKEEVIEEIKKIIIDEFYKLEEIEKDFKINQEIIRTRNKIIKLLK